MAGENVDEYVTPGAPHSTAEGGPGNTLQMGIYASLLALVGLVYGGYFYIQREEETMSLVGQLPEDVVSATYSLAVQGDAGELWSVNGETGDRRLLVASTSIKVYPAWSHDGRYIAFADQDDNIVAVTADGSQVLQLIDPTQGQPSYVSWSPDDEHLASIMVQDTGLDYCITSLAGDYSSLRLEPGLPSFWNWSADSKFLLWHYKNEVRRYAIKANGAPYDSIPSATQFQNAAWGKEDRSIFRVIEEGAAVSLVEYNLDDGQEHVIRSDCGYIRVLSSPDRKYLAYTDNVIRPRRGRSVGTATLLSLATGDHEVIFPNAINALYWSPDSRYLAIYDFSRYSGGQNASGLVQLYEDGQGVSTTGTSNTGSIWFYDTQERQLLPGVAFVPTHRFHVTTGFFGQYGASHSLWSPDSRAFAVAAIDPELRRGCIWVMDISGATEPRNMGEGELASWTWR